MSCFSFLVYFLPFIVTKMSQSPLSQSSHEFTVVSPYLSCFGIEECLFYLYFKFYDLCVILLCTWFDLNE
ncbi:hypothetical protein ISN44_As04g007360 [Arabidopsis suecica]|uniref:Uncharacterized protein n=1 Tax=Arabidopsis suecica TaxID=45249 RepID=A0A8T2E6B3_ARASU|nr:hypothetical protein ISN44_As04g007360 [Arabidopsis suecica]